MNFCMKVKQEIRSNREFVGPELTAGGRRARGRAAGASEAGGRLVRLRTRLSLGGSAICCDCAGWKGGERVPPTDIN